MFDTILLTNTVVHALRETQPFFHALFGVRTLSRTLRLEVSRVTWLGTGYHDTPARAPRAAAAAAAPAQAAGGRGELGPRSQVRCE